MPIYAYRCDECHFAKDVLQKMSDPQLTVCLSCGKASFKKQLTAAGFQLKGTGWYATDFRGGNNSNGTDAAKTDSPKPSTASEAAPVAAPVAAAKSAAATATPATPATPASPAPTKAV